MLYKRQLCLPTIILSSLFIFFQPTRLNCQALPNLKVGEELLEQGKIKEALTYGNNSLKALANNSKKNKDSLLILTYILLGDCALYQLNLKETKLQYENAKKLSDISNSSFLKATVNFKQGNYFAKLNETDIALEYYVTAKRLLEQTTVTPLLADIYNNIGNRYLVTEDYRTALDYHRQALRIRKRTLDEGHIDIADSYNNIGSCLYRNEQFYDALGYYENALQILDNLESDFPERRAQYLNNIGNCYYEAKDFENAKTNFSKSVSILKSTFKIDHPSIATSLTNLAKIHEVQEKWGRSESFYKEALNIQVNFYGKKNIAVAQAQRNLAILYLNQGLYDLALQSIRDAFSSLGYAKEEGFDQVLSFSSLMNLFYLEGIIYNAQFYKFENPDYLKKALDCFERIAGLVEFMDNSGFRWTSNRGLLGETRIYWEEAVLTCIKLYESGDSHALEEAFKYAEKGKATILFKAFLGNEVEQFATVPETILDRERKFKSEINQLENLFFLEKQNGLQTQVSVLDTIEKYIFLLKQNYSSFKDSIQLSYPDYSKIKVSDSALSIGDVQKRLLPPESTILEYFVSEEELYAFVISKDSTFLFPLGKNENLSQRIIQLNQNILGYGIKKEGIGFNDFQNQAHQLYMRLIAPLKPHLTKKVIIIPDGVLGMLSFETLLVSLNDEEDKKNHFLFEDHIISYAYSANSLLQMQNQDRSKALKPFLSIVPDFMGDSRESFRPLPLAKSETESIRQIINRSEEYADDMAKKDLLIPILSDYQTLHFATHGQANTLLGDYSFLALTEDTLQHENGFLYTKDLYGLDLNAELVVLSACETAVGSQQQGEGIISLSQGFAYAGSSSLVTTLWSVEDTPTMIIMEAFYKNLKSGQRKDEALWKAKKQYLDKVRREEDKHPFNWAGIIAIGKMDSLNLLANDRSIFNSKWLYLGIVLIGIGYFFIRRKL